MTTSALRFGASTCGLVLVLSVAAVPREPASAQARRIELTALLDAYAQGRHDEALARVQQASRDMARGVRAQLAVRGIQWVDAEPADRSRRALAAAAFALEMERIRAELGEWPRVDENDCAGRCVIEWACALLQSRGAPDDAERVWFLATIALAGGVRDWSYLQSPLAPPSERRPENGHVHHALARFPDELRFRLARAVALASRNAVTEEWDSARGRHGSPVPGAVTVGPAFVNSMLQRNRGRLTDYVRQELEALATHDSVGDEAQVRLGYLHRVAGDDAGALAAERAAAEATADPDLQYVAHFVAAQAAQSLGDGPAAEVHYRAALAARPHSQAATLGLAALLYLRGEGREAYELVADARSKRPRDDDPWRMFLYGDFPKLPALVGELRRRVAP